MVDIYKLIVFLFVAILLLYMIRLRFLTKFRLELHTHTFTVLLIGLAFCTVATFLDMINFISSYYKTYIIIRVCFTLGAILFIIGIILWSHYTQKVIEQLKEMALKDPMTGAYNRNGIEKIYKSISESNNIFFLVVGDLDRLKKINDEYGHLAGDKYIADASEIILDEINSKGFVGRIGGDEFVMLLESKDIYETEQIISAIKNRVFKISLKKSTSISLGYSIFPEEGRTLEDLVKVADKRMYIDKKSKESEFQKRA